MNATLNFCYSFEYLWEDGVKYKRPTKLAAPDYVDALMNWAQSLLDDEAIFPNKIGKHSNVVCPPHVHPGTCPPGVQFPRNFRDTVRTIVRRLFRVYAHLYSNHFDHICALGIEGIGSSSLHLASVPNVTMHSTPQHKLSALFPLYQRGQ
jgi:Mob1/phocein family